MGYNYFVCRKCMPPVRYAAPEPNGIAGVFASPMCPSCGKTMEWHGRGDAAADARPIPPPLPVAQKEKVKNEKIDIYSGSGMNPGHGWVTWEIYRNPAKAVIMIEIMLGHKQGGNWDSVQKFAMADGLLDTTQGGGKEGWWLSAPLKRYAHRAIWHEINLKGLMGVTKPAKLPDTLQIGVKLGNAFFGLIHLLHGHASSVRAIGDIEFAESTERSDDVFRTMLLLQAGMQRFQFDSVQKISFDPTTDKMVIQGSHSGKIVLTRIGDGPRFGITTMFNTGHWDEKDVIYEA